VHTVVITTNNRKESQVTENKTTMSPGMSAAYQALNKIGYLFFVLAVLGGLALGFITDGAPIALAWFVLFGVGWMTCLAGASGVRAAAGDQR
jgi:hypothetical protein